MQSCAQILTLLFACEADFREDSPVMAYLTPIEEEGHPVSSERTPIHLGSAIINAGLAQKGSHPTNVVKARVCGVSLV